MNYMKIKKRDISNGPGVRVSLYVSGCRHHCKNCFNPETWPFEAGEVYDDSVTEQIIEELRLPFVKGLSLLGGDPFEPGNQAQLVKLLRRVRSEFPDKTVWCYTGYDYEKDILTGKLSTGRKSPKSMSTERMTVGRQSTESIPAESVAAKSISEGQCSDGFADPEGCAGEKRFADAGDSTDAEDSAMELLSMIDVLVDGEFVEELKVIDLRFRGSTNQRIIDVKKSLESDEVVIWHDEEQQIYDSISL